MARRSRFRLYLPRDGARSANPAACSNCNVHEYEIRILCFAINRSWKCFVEKSPYCSRLSRSTSSTVARFTLRYGAEPLRLSSTPDNPSAKYTSFNRRM
jgi:hypothetical protein